ncbi:DinB family protein [Streptomyces sp. 110]|uniref:DinB family protein n=1 Tax=Streptomyces endocoffeicus TaxID=2898945 RepID=A0ABS1PKF3_9ACTN|nr:DinB family protein [Streptomyces endocoffeicus]MBL1112877.1 DinB family protein [Streptomyces endocoffeicus]
MELNEYLYFLRRAFDGMIGALEELGDELANTVPPPAGANSPFAVAYHCTGVADYWIGHVIAGRSVDRDRASEFTAVGTVADLKSALDPLFDRLRDDLRGVDAQAAPRKVPPASFEGPDRPLSCAGVQLHVLEELAQHHGQVQITRDVLLNGTVR